LEIGKIKSGEESASRKLFGEWAMVTVKPDYGRLVQTYPTSTKFAERREK
jgi:hypothetical protein